MMTTNITLAIPERPSTETWEAQAWQQLLARDSSADFLYAVTTTGVFCRPYCASRRPLRQNTRFFPSVAQAKAAGFRPCLRCQPEQPGKPAPVARICAYLESRIDRPVRLAELGKLVGVSPFTAQRLFKQAMGVTPSQYQRAIRASTLRSQLRNAETTVTTAIYESGYGSSSRAYESSPLGMTPSKFAAGGRGETIRFAIAASEPSPALSPLGSLIVASTKRGICWLALGASSHELEAGLHAEFPAATIVPDPALANTIAEILSNISSRENQPASSTLPLDLRGTAFQLRVWKALQEIPSGETRTYSGLAAQMGMPAATRAVARACALNRVSVLVPCHRVVSVSGSLTGYRWGIQRKQLLLQNELQAESQAQPSPR